jgi:hypothetical protein
VSFAGTISRLVAKATYTVNSDCTATFTTTDGTQHFDMRTGQTRVEFAFGEFDPRSLAPQAALRTATDACLQARNRSASGAKRTPSMPR